MGLSFQGLARKIVRSTPIENTYEDRYGLTLLFSPTSHVAILPNIAFITTLPHELKWALAGVVAAQDAAYDSEKRLAAPLTATSRRLGTGEARKLCMRSLGNRAPLLPPSCSRRVILQDA